MSPHSTYYLCMILITAAMSHPSPSPKSNSLLSTIKKNIIILNSKLPESLRGIWVSGIELHDRLIWAGVSKRLKLSHVEDALRRNNIGEVHLAVWKYNLVKYYRCKRAHILEGEKITLPVDQRFKTRTPQKKMNANISSTAPRARININPERDYFVGKGVTELEEINEALKMLEQEQKDGVEHSTSVGPTCHDGAGCTRVYNNRHRGRQSAFVVNS